ncbi:MAG: deoxyribose-phosphate aldolase [Planctomycetes bacterium]|nr:deoxyribose-phosphate aldolase [Planctomycetota bacterium]
MNLATKGAREIVASAPHVDTVGAVERATALTKRSIKKESKRWALELALSMVDLTTLEGMDTPGKVRSLCAKARRPWEGGPAVPAVAAVCVYPSMVPVAVEALRGSSIKVASVATAFPSGKSPLALRLDEVRWCVEHGAHEIDMVIDRGAFLAGEYALVFDEIAAIKEACGPAHLKVILETGELQTYDRVRQASELAMHAGGDFIKTSTGKVPSAATLPVTLVMLEAIRDFHDATGKLIGMKPAGGIRSAKQAIQYLVLVNETLGERWLDPDLFRLGASSLVNDILRQLAKERSGRYASLDDFPID